MLLAGDPLSAADATEYGLISELCDPGAALDTAHKLARIAPNAPLAIAGIKEVLRSVQALDDAQAFARQDELVGGLLKSEDAHEGAMAFAEKRAPVWHGR
jgi:enoyl-CoA hydratase